MSESILAILRHEHSVITEMLDQIEKTKKTSLRTSLFFKLKEELVAHMAGEEQTLYAKLRQESREKAASSIAEEADQEHHELKEYLQRLTLMEPESEEWLKEFHSFKEHLEQHVREEETEMFEEAKEDFTKAELEQMTNEFEEVKHHPIA